MRPIPDHLRHMDLREGLVPAGHLTQAAASLALRRSLPTMDHAIRLVAAVRALLGARLWLDPAPGDTHERLHWRAPDAEGWMAAAPSLELLHGREENVTIATLVQGDPDDAAASQRPPPPPRPQLRPRGPTMHAGALTLSEGRSNYTLNYDAEGLFRDCMQTGGDLFNCLHHANDRPPMLDPLARPPTEPPPSLLCRADLHADGHSVEDLAPRVAALDPFARAPGLVRVPVPVPTRADGLWTTALLAIRRALYDGRVSPAEGFVIADGLEGTALASGPTLEDAHERWQGELFRAKPRPPRPPEPPPEPPPETAPPDAGAGASVRPLAPYAPRKIVDDEGKLRGFSTGRITLSAPPRVGPPLDWPASVPANIPAAAVPLPASPPPPPEPFIQAGFSQWVPVVGAAGHVHHVLRRLAPDGSITLIGRGALDLVDPATLDAELAAAELAQRAEDAEIHAQFGHPSPWDDPQYGCAVVHYRCWDDDRRARTALRRGGAAFGPAFDPGGLDGDAAAWTVTQVRVARG